MEDGNPQINKDDYIEYHGQYYIVSRQAAVSSQAAQSRKYEFKMTRNEMKEKDKPIWKWTFFLVNGKTTECLVNSKITRTPKGQIQPRNVKKITDYSVDSETITVTYQNIDPREEKTHAQLKIESKFREKATPKLNALATMSPKIISTCLKINQESLTKNYELFMVYEKFVKNAKIFLNLIQSYRKIVGEYSEELGNAISLFDDPKLTMYVEENKEMMDNFNKEVNTLISEGVEFSDDIQKDIHAYLPPFDLKFAKKHDTLKILETEDGVRVGDKFKHKKDMKTATFEKRISMDSFEIYDDRSHLTLKETDDKNIFIGVEEGGSDSHKKYKIFNTDAIGRYHQLQEFGTDLTTIFQHELKTNPPFKDYVNKNYESPDGQKESVGTDDQVSATKVILNGHFNDLLTEDDNHFAPIIKLKCGDVYYPVEKEKKDGDEPVHEAAPEDVTATERVTATYEYQVTHVDKLDL